MIHFHWSFVSHNDLTIHFRERWKLYSFLYKLLPVSQSINCVDFQVEQIKSCNSGSCNSSGNNIVMNHILCAFLLHRFPIALCILRLQFVFFLSSIFCITFSLQRSFSNKFINQTIEWNLLYNLSQIKGIKHFPCAFWLLKKSIQFRSSSFHFDRILCKKLVHPQSGAKKSTTSLTRTKSRMCETQSSNRR